MSVTQSGNRLDSRVPGSSPLGWGVGLAIASLLLVPTATRAQMQALPPPPSAPNSFPSPDINTAPLTPTVQPLPGIPGSPAPQSVYPMPTQGISSYGGAYQVIVYGASPYLLRQIKFLEPNASMQTYQGRQVIVAGSFDSPAAAQQRVLALSDYGIGAQAVAANPAGSMGGVSQQAAAMPFPMTNGMAPPTGNAMNPSPMVPTAEMPPNLAPNAAPNGFGAAPTAIAPTGMPMNALPPVSVTAPTAIAPTGMPTSALPDAASAPMSTAPGMPMNALPNAPMDGAIVAPPPGMPMNSLPPNVPMSTPMGNPPLGAATVTPPTTAMPGNSNPEARFEVVIPARAEDFNAIANRLVSMGVRPDAIQARQQPRGPHISVGPYMQAREAEAMTKLLRMGGMDARVFYGR